MSRKKRNKHFWKEKQLIRLKMKDVEIHQAIKNQGWIELDEPLPNGYYAEWVLRADILRREDVAAFQEALDACKERIWNRNSEFRYKNKKTKKWEKINPKLKALQKEAYDKLSPSAQKFFYETTDTQKYWRPGFSNKHYRCTLSYELVVKITKAFITHRREHDGVLYQMDAENEKMMYQVAGNGNPWGWRGDYSSWWKRMENKKEKLKAEREIVDVVKKYKSSDEVKTIKKIRDLE